MSNSLISKIYFPQFLLFSKITHLKKSYICWLYVISLRSYVILLLPLFKTTPPIYQLLLFLRKIFWTLFFAKISQTQSLNSKFKFFCLIASTKFQATTEVFYNLSLVNTVRYCIHISLSILWMTYYYNAILLCVRHKGCCCDFSGFWGFNSEIEDLFLYCLLDVLVVCDKKRGVLKKECQPEICREQTRKGKKDNKE